MKRVTFILAGWFILSGWLLLAPAHAASFDCAQARTDVEKLICADNALSKLDDSLEAQYRQALKRHDIRETVKQSQQDWLKNSRNICRTGECVKKAYDTRIKQLGMTTSFGMVFMTVPPGAKPPAPAPSAPRSTTSQPAAPQPAAPAREARPPAGASPVLGGGQ